MKKQFLNLGKALSRAEQRSINGGLKNPLNELPEDGGGGGCSMEDSYDCDCPSGSNGNMEGCGCNSDNDCIMGRCWKGMWGVGMFGHCSATL